MAWLGIVLDVPKLFENPPWIEMEAVRSLKPEKTNMINDNKPI